ncbi:MAG: hypothetical protein AB1511_07025 [Deinococcota bacterium]
MTYWAELVELYEYKVADVLAGRVPRGGRRSLADLRDTLLAAPLEPALYRRLIQTDRQYRARHGQDASPTPLPTAEPAWTAPVTSNTPEARAWEELQQLAWFAGLRTNLLQLGRTLQAEPGLLTLRALYAVVENADRDARGVAQRLAVPAAHDPLVSLHHPDVTRDLMLTLADQLLHPAGRARLRLALNSVQDIPFPRHPDADVLEARVEAAGREPLAPQAREALIQALRASLPGTRDPRERPAIREAVRSLHNVLEDLLKDAPRPTLGVIPPRSILYAAHTPATLPAPDDSAEQLVIRLEGGQAARWRGLELRWQPVGPMGQAPNWQLQVEGQVVLLRPDRPPAERILTLATPQLSLHVAFSSGYLLLRAEVHSGKTLGLLAAQARAVALLLDPAERYANLRLARAAAQHLQGGRVDVAALDPDSADKYAASPPDTLLAFARRGVDLLRARLTSLSPTEAEAAVQASAALLGLPAPRARCLAEALHAATFVPEPLPPAQELTQVNVPEDGRFVSVRLTREPLTLSVLGRALTLRLNHQGDLAAVLPGFPAALLHDLLVLRLPGGQVLLLREGDTLAAAACPHKNG